MDEFQCSTTIKFMNKTSVRLRKKIEYILLYSLLSTWDNSDRYKLFVNTNILIVVKSSVDCIHFKSYFLCLEGYGNEPSRARINWKETWLPHTWLHQILDCGILFVLWRNSHLQRHYHDISLANSYTFWCPASNCQCRISMTLLFRNMNMRMKINMNKHISSSCSAHSKFKH